MKESFIVGTDNFSEDTEVKTGKDETKFEVSATPVIDDKGNTNTPNGEGHIIKQAEGEKGFSNPLFDLCPPESTEETTINEDTMKDKEESRNDVEVFHDGGTYSSFANPLYGNDPPTSIATENPEDITFGVINPLATIETGDANETGLCLPQCMDIYII